MARSESPLTASGRVPLQDNVRLQVQLQGSDRETLFQAAHVHSGDWRNWREIAEESGISDPFEVGSGSGVLTPIPDTPGASTLNMDVISSEGVNLSEELGHVVEYTSTTFAPSHVLALCVDDVDFSTFALSVDGGPPVNVSTSSFPISATLTTPEASIDVVLSSEVWAIVWFARDCTLTVPDFADTLQTPTTNLIVPRRRVRVSRGE